MNEDHYLAAAIAQPLYPVGYICLTENFCLAVYGKKPSAFHRLMLRLFFGISWRDA